MNKKEYEEERQRLLTTIEQHKRIAGEAQLKLQDLDERYNIDRYLSAREDRRDNDRHPPIPL